MEVGQARRNDEPRPLLGSADFIEDMVHHGSGGTATRRIGASGIRLLAVAPDARGLGIGKALTRHCIDAARALGRSAVAARRRV